MDIRTACRRPARSAPQLLSIPNRADVERAFRRTCGPVKMIAIELERGHTQTFGDTLELFVFTREPNLTINHVMPGRQINMGALIAAAEILGQTAALQARRRGIKWASGNSGKASTRSQARST